MNMILALIHFASNHFFFLLTFSCVRTCTYHVISIHILIYCTHKNICWNFEVCTYIHNCCISIFNKSAQVWFSAFKNEYTDVFIQIWMHDNLRFTCVDLIEISKINSFLSKTHAFLAIFFFFGHLTDYT